MVVEMGLLSNHFKMKSERGITLIEMMVVVVIIGILAGISLNIVNIRKQKARATDAKNLANLQKATTGIEAYYYSEGNYPTVEEFDAYLSGEDDTSPLNTYLTNAWPESFTYITSGGEFAVFVQRTEEDGNYYKYISSLGRIATCDVETQRVETDVESCTEVE